MTQAERITECIRQHGSATDSELCAALGLTRYACREARGCLIGRNIVAPDSPRRYRPVKMSAVPRWRRETVYVLRPLPAGEAREHFG